MIQSIKKAQKDKKTSFLKETVENADLHKPLLNKTMATQEYCRKYDFVAPMSALRTLDLNILELSTLFHKSIPVS